jgi:DNA polymerase I
MELFAVIRIKDSLAGKPIRLHAVESSSDLFEVRDFIRDSAWLGFDTESNMLNCFRPDWRLRTAQWGDREISYVVPARYRKFIEWATVQPCNLIGHNLPHDIRSVDVHLGHRTGMRVAGETYHVSRLADTRGKQDGGIGHGLKELACATVDPTADRWEKRLKEEFKRIMVRVPGEFYKSGPRKGNPKFRKAKLSEGWDLIDPTNPAYVAYAAMDPILTFWVWEHFQPILKDQSQLELYRYEKRLALACDELQRRALPLDIPYTMKLSAAYQRKIDRTNRRIVRQFHVDNVNSTVQIADCLLDLKVELRKKTDTGKWSVKAEILRALLKDPQVSRAAKEFISLVLIVKQVSKRRAAYTEAMLREVDANGRVHPGINSDAARTTRMSVSNPAFQQLPVKDHESELDWELEDDVDEVLEGVV